VVRGVLVEDDASVGKPTATRKASENGRVTTSNESDESTFRDGHSKLGRKAFCEEKASAWKASAHNSFFCSNPPANKKRAGGREQ